MTLLAYGCIEQQPDGRWLCRRATTVNGRYGPVDVAAGQAFALRSAFAGFDDFAAHLAAVAVDGSSRPPHEW